MEEKIFLDPACKPTEEALRNVLGGAFSFYTTLMSMTGSFAHDWNFSKSSGWMMKIHDQKKALFYLIPLKNGFKANLTIRENEKTSFSADAELRSIHDQIQSAKKFTEGYALYFTIATESEFQIFEILMGKLIKLRGK